MTRLSDQPDAISINVDYLPLYVRLAAASWCIDTFGQNNVDLWYNKNDKPHFWFRSEKDAMWFTLKWSK